ncbi:STAS domain-containing protein [Acinetobacter boissieri]|uniref:Phospholipid transport system transporter-binding protein n=1 Tax=Acinetobacter boissieri TaxID=1219383 RepID=A0A1G6K019_9GAMM|nr:STAS domain-containing protein [Acinetobacter boissieri]SDC24372.1 phospholipid transport system transporter-binding protein [Acinetobacter boissieri]
MRAELNVVNQSLVVKGQIDFTNAEQVYQQGLGAILKQTSFPVVIDLSALEHGNTLVLAVFVQWIRQVPNVNDLVFKSVPKKMLKIIESCHLEHQLNMVA